MLPWHRNPSYDFRLAPYAHPDFTCNALSEDLFSASLKNWIHNRVICGFDKAFA